LEALWVWGEPYAKNDVGNKKEKKYSPQRSSGATEEKQTGKKKPWTPRGPNLLPETALRTDVREGRSKNR